MEVSDETKQNFLKHIALTKKYYEHHGEIMNSLQNLVIVDLGKIVCEYYDDVFLVCCDLDFPDYNKIEIVCKVSHEALCFQYKLCRHNWWYAFNLCKDSIVEKHAKTPIDQERIDELPYFTDFKDGHVQRLSEEIVYINGSWNTIYRMIIDEIKLKHVIAILDMIMEMVGLTEYL